MKLEHNDPCDMTKCTKARCRSRVKQKLEKGDGQPWGAGNLKERNQAGRIWEEYDPWKFGSSNSLLKDLNHQTTKKSGKFYFIVFVLE